MDATMKDSKNRKITENLGTPSNFWTGELLRTTCKVALLTGLCAGTMAAQATLPDAQVEANVLKALASAPDLANEPIQTRTVYGTVTLSGSVTDETLRKKAETLASNANGVKKVVDELTLGQPSGAAANAAPASNMQLQSDGTWAPADGGQPNPQAAAAPNPAAGVTNPQRNDPDADAALDQQMDHAAASVPGQQPPQQANNGYPPNGYPPQQYPQPGQYPQAGQYPQNPNGQYPPSAYPPYRQRYGAPNGPYAQGYPQPYAGQVGGKVVTIPNGAVLNVRINERLSSNHDKPGDVFNGIVVNDVYAGGAIAIPRGAAVQGKVIDATKSGSLAGRGEMSIQLTQLMLGGNTYPLQSDIWKHAGPDKTLETVNRTVGLGAFGALIGAVAGGGAGAAIGAGAGAAAGLGTSAASGKGQVVVPPEAVIAFHVAAPTQVTTVSQQEMQRLAYGVGSAPPVMYRRYPYPPPPPGYYGPVYPY
jgi:hypothetical protein